MYSLKQTSNKFTPTFKKILSKHFSEASKSTKSASSAFHEIYTSELEKLKKHK